MLMPILDLDLDNKKIWKYLTWEWESVILLQKQWLNYNEVVISTISYYCNHYYTCACLPTELKYYDLIVCCNCSFLLCLFTLICRLNWLFVFIQRLWRRPKLYICMIVDSTFFIWKYIYLDIHTRFIFYI